MKAVVTKKTYFIFTCEHAYNRSPKNLNIPSRILNSHRAFDPGARDLVRHLCKSPNAYAFYFPYSRLVIDANRSLKSPNLFSEYSYFVSQKQRQSFIKAHTAYRTRVLSLINKLKKQGDVVVISVHSFTPVYKGKKRKTDIGLLFRPQNKNELDLAKHFKKVLKKIDPQLKVHFNLPYRGHTDCFLNDILDKHKNAKNISGLFLEINQKLV